MGKALWIASTTMRVFAKVVEERQLPGAGGPAQHFRQYGQPACEGTVRNGWERGWLRTTRRSASTDTGRGLLRALHPAAGRISRNRASVSDNARDAPRELRVNATPSFGILHLAPAIADFTTRFPAISVELMLSNRIGDLIEKVLMSPVARRTGSDSSLIARQLAPCRVVVCGARAISRGTGCRRTPADLTVPQLPSRWLDGLSTTGAWHLTAATAPR